jgi:HNH endonuclease
MIARTRHVTPTDERRVFTDRFFTIQPNLDESRYRMWGEAPGVIGRVIDKAICDRADQLRATAGVLPSTRGQRQLDALGAMAQDSLDGSTSETPSSGHVTVFVDARRENPTETTAEIEYGPRVGPDALEQMLCTGRVQIVGLDNNGIPVVTSPAARSIPPAIRHAVTHRDGVCVIDGCTSRYRLEPHHIIRHADGGSHHLDNLATICWYHHHVAIHGNGYRIDPESPPHRRRLIRGSPQGPDPP